MDDRTSCANNSVFVASKFNCTVQTRSHYNKRNQRMRARRIMVCMGSNVNRIAISFHYINAILLTGFG
uniref:Uncharacterized protein n=1 Tax=Solanum tuberosum TaxID=4113 RepID=M1D5C3_SOLTU